MTIDRVNPPDPLSKYNRAQKAARTRKGGKSDAIEVSAEAKSKAEVYNATEAAKSSPDIRWELVDRIKEEMKNPDYPSRQIIEATADRIMRGLLGEEQNES